MAPTAEKRMTGPTQVFRAGDWHHRQQLQQQQQQQQHPRKHHDTVHPPTGGTDATASSHRFPDDLEEVSHTRSPRQLHSAPQQRKVSSEEPSTSSDSTGLQFMEFDHRVSDPAIINEIFYKEPCLHTHRMFCRAANIFAALRHSRGHDDMPGLHRRKTLANLDTRPKIQIPEMDFKDTAEKKTVYELAFATLKYQYVFDDILDDTNFFNYHSELREDGPLVMVILWDYQSRKFQPRVAIGDEVLHETCLEIEQAILDMKTKLNASLARRRIKASAPSIEHLLPLNVRSKSSSQQPLPVYAWVNQLKTNANDLLEQLKDDGFQQTWKIPTDSATFTDKTFFVDPHCSDMLVFSMDCAPLLQEHPLVVSGQLVREDKSSCLAAHSVLPLLSEEKDVVVVNPGSGLVVAHLASLIVDKGGQVVVISDGGKDAHHKLLRNMELLGASKCVKYIVHPFPNVDLEDSRLRNVRVALIIADCSKSAIKNAVAFVVHEGEDLQILKDLSASEEENSGQLNGLMAKHINVLRHALRLNKLQGAVYLTRSVNMEENEVAVERALEYVNMLQVQVKKMLPWRVIPPVLPFSGDDVEYERGIVGKYVKFQPTSMMNGCFLVAIAREPDEPKPITGRSRSRGLTGKGSKSRANGSLTSGESTPGSSQESPQTPDVGEGKHKRKGSSTKKAKKPFQPVTTARAALLKKKLSMAEKAAARLAQPQHPVAKKDSNPEHIRVVKHPAPFSVANEPDTMMGRQRGTSI